MKKAILALLSAFILSTGAIAQSNPSDTTKTNVVKQERVYTQPVDNGDGTATYQGQLYKIETGPRGGRYIIKTSSKTGKQYKMYLKIVV